MSWVLRLASLSAVLCAATPREGIRLSAPGPVTEEDVRRLCLLAGVGPDASDRARELLIAHQQATSQEWGRVRADLDSLSSELAQIGDAAHRESEVAEVWASGFAARRELAAQMFSLQDRYFQRWLADESNVGLSEVAPKLQHRWRRWQSTTPRSMVPGGDLQLDIFILDTLAPPLFDGQGPELRELLEQYESDCGDLHRRRSAARLEAESAAPAVFALQFDAATPEKQASAALRFRELGRPAADLDRLLATRNLDALEGFAAALASAGAPESASALTDAYLAKVFPKIHPDPTDPRSIVEAWLDEHSGSASEIANGRALLLASIQQRAEICQSMRRALVDYSHRLAVTRSLQEADQPRHEETMKRLAAQRVALTVALRDALAPDMPAEVVAAIDRLIPKERGTETPAQPGGGARTRGSSRVREAGSE